MSERENTNLRNPIETRVPPAGPHAKERLTDHEKTPGTGALPAKDQKEADVGPD